jgi:hypothetical protein
MNGGSCFLNKDVEKSLAMFARKVYSCNLVGTNGQDQQYQEIKEIHYP